MTCHFSLDIWQCALDDGSIFMDTITELVALDVAEAVAVEEPLDSLWEVDFDSPPPQLHDSPPLVHNFPPHEVDAIRSHSEYSHAAKSLRPAEARGEETAQLDGEHVRVHARRASS